MVDTVVKPIKQEKYKKIIADDISKFLEEEGIDYDTLMSLPDDE
jgi:hypothetical protein